MTKSTNEIYYFCRLLSIWLSIERRNDFIICSLSCKVCSIVTVDKFLNGGRVTSFKKRIRTYLWFGTT